MNNTSTYFKLNGRPSVIKYLFLEYKFLNLTTMENLHFLKQFFLLQYNLTKDVLQAVETVYYSPQSTR